MVKAGGTPGFISPALGGGMGGVWWDNTGGWEPTLLGLLGGKWGLMVGAGEPGHLGSAPAIAHVTPQPGREGGWDAASGSF